MNFGFWQFGLIVSDHLGSKDYERGWGMGVVEMRVCCFGDEYLVGLHSWGFGFWGLQVVNQKSVAWDQGIFAWGRIYGVSFSRCNLLGFFQWW